jgi:hypothetical protein
MRKQTALVVLMSATLIGASLAGPAAAKVYNVVFAGKVVPVDCPESPEGHNMTWVSQNCTAVRVAPAGSETMGVSRTGKVTPQPK